MHHFDKWRDTLRIAPNVKAVSGLMRDYIAAIEPAVISVLPGDCRAALTDPLDVQMAAVTLMQAELLHRGSAQTDALLHELAHTFAAASVRITALHGKPLQG